MTEYDTLVLCGAGLNGCGILGALQYMKDSNLIANIDTYIGTSIGAVISYLLIIGFTPVEIMVYLCTHKIMFEKIKSFDYVKASRGEGMTSFIYISDELEKMTIQKTGRLYTLKDLEIFFNKKLICVTFNLTENRVEYLEQGDLPCLTALRMSCNLPLVFEAFKYGNSFYIDGGVANNFALTEGEKRGKKVLGINILRPINTEANIPGINIVEYFYRLIEIPVFSIQNHQIDNKAETTDVITIVSEKYVKIFQFDFNPKEMLEIFSKGYEDARKFYLEEI